MSSSRYAADFRPGHWSIYGDKGQGEDMSERY